MCLPPAQGCSSTGGQLDPLPPPPPAHSYRPPPPRASAAWIREKQPGNLGGPRAPNHYPPSTRKTRGGRWLSVVKRFERCAALVITVLGHNFFGGLHRISQDS